MKIIDDIRADLSQKFPQNSFQYSYAFGNNVLEVSRDMVVPVLQHFRQTRQFDFLMHVAGADFPERPRRFEVSYELFSSRNARRLRVKTQVGEGESVPTVQKIWKTADWFEREAYDMFGIQFEGHPNLRRLLTHHQFQGHPLRKDYPADLQQHCTEALWG